MPLKPLDLQALRISELEKDNARLRFERGNLHNHAESTMLAMISRAGLSENREGLFLDSNDPMGLRKIAGYPQQDRLWTWISVRLFRG